MSAPKKVAILGGGVSAMTTAFELTRPELDGQYEVTVYQLGWRLGGKGASGRNAAVAQRIEEHGLHIWMGFYDNAFRVMQEAYGGSLAPRGRSRRGKTLSRSIATSSSASRSAGKSTSGKSICRPTAKSPVRKGTTRQSPR